jgi:hypothetical protein
MRRVDLRPLFRGSLGRKIAILDLIIMKIILEDFLRYSAQPILYRMGEEVGRRYSEVFNKEKMTSEEQLVNTIALIGELKKEKIEIKTKSNVRATIKDGWEAKAYQEKQNRPSCHYTRGLLAGIILHSLNKKGRVKETKCKAAGDALCEFIFVEG